MTPGRARIAGLIGAAAVAACTPAPRPAPAVTTPPAAGSVCRVGPDGGPALAERGIGGTGAPVTQTAERGIGGTGIIGVVTGFASICLAGQEVAMPPDVPVEIGGVSSDPRSLRAGQVAAVEAGGSPGALYARRITVRYEVQGPVEAVSPDQLRVAGQTVLLSADTWLRTPPALGQWVAVSGLRDGSGAIAATRLDLVSTRTLLIHGVVQPGPGGYHIGGMPITMGPGTVMVPGLPVSVTGVYGDGPLRPASMTADLFGDPVAYFGGATSSYIVEGFGTMPLLQAPASSRPFGPGRMIVEFERTRTGIRIESVVPSDRFGGGALGGRVQQPPLPSRDGAGPARSFEPAPVPNRAAGFGGPQDGGGGGNRSGGGGSGGGGGRSSLNPGGPAPGGIPGDGTDRGGRHR